MEPYRSYFPHAGLLLPQTERLVQRVLSLPNGSAVSGGEISVIAEIIKLTVRNGKEISCKLEQENLFKEH
jgi:dTDP-4-amino-4,6-dideoxygalactose transaminase